MEGLDRAPANKVISEISHRDYAQSLHTLEQFTHMDTSTILVGTDPKVVIDVIKTNFKGLQSRRNLINGIMSTFKHNPEIKVAPETKRVWIDYRDEMNVAMKAHYGSNKRTTRQLAADIEWKVVLAKRELMDKMSMGYLLVAMYTMQAPHRSNFGSLRIMHHDPTSSKNQNDGNYLVVLPTSIRLTMNSFKSKGKRHSQFSAILPEPLEAVIRGSLERHPRRYLLVPRPCHTNDNKGDRHDKSFPSSKSYNAFANKILNDHIKKGVTLTSLRNIFITYMSSLKLTITRRQQIADSMLHTRGVAEAYNLMNENDDGVDLFAV